MNILLATESFHYFKLCQKNTCRNWLYAWKAEQRPRVFKFNLICICRIKMANKWSFFKQSRMCSHDGVLRKFPLQESFFSNDPILDSSIISVRKNYECDIIWREVLLRRIRSPNLWMLRQCWPPSVTNGIYKL